MPLRVSASLNLCPRCLPLLPHPHPSPDREGRVEAGRVLRRRNQERKANSTQPKRCKYYCLVPSTCNGLSGHTSRVQSGKSKRNENL